MICENETDELRTRVCRCQFRKRRFASDGKEWTLIELQRIVHLNDHEFCENRRLEINSYNNNNVNKLEKFQEIEIAIKVNQDFKDSVLEKL